ncbi:MAG: PHP domain-containing protein [Candidatus Thorarchaeota archaeon]
MIHRADLHLHSNVSDGIHTPSQLVEMGSRLALGGIALTDHDTIEGNREFLSAGGAKEMVRIPGVEISTEYREKEVHLLGYYVPLESERLENRLQELEEARIERLPKMVDKLEDLGVNINGGVVNRILQNTTTPGRPHLARALVEEGVVEDVNQAFKNYLGKKKPAYVKKDRMKTNEAIRLLKSEASVPVLAHPLTIETDDYDDFIGSLVDEGLLGIETEYNYQHLAVEGSNYEIRQIAREYNLIETGGSDHHGDDVRSLIGEVTVSMEIVDELADEAERLK